MMARMISCVLERTEVRSKTREILDPCVRQLRDRMQESLQVIASGIAAEERQLRPAVRLVGRDPRTPLLLNESSTTAAEAA